MTTQTIILTFEVDEDCNKDGFVEAIRKSIFEGTDSLLENEDTALLKVYNIRALD